MNDTFATSMNIKAIPIVGEFIEFGTPGRHSCAWLFFFWLLRQAYLPDIF
jgi:hypothetical protein